MLVYQKLPKENQLTLVTRSFIITKCKKKYKLIKNNSRLNFQQNVDKEGGDFVSMKDAIAAIWLQNNHRRNIFNLKISTDLNNSIAGRRLAGS